MKRGTALLALFVLLPAACGRKPEGPPDAAPSSTPSASSPPKKPTGQRSYTYANYTDWLGRYTVDLPKELRRSEARACDADECTADLTLEGDGIRISIEAPKASREYKTLEADKADNGKPVISEQPLSRGWRYRTASGFTEQRTGFVQPIRLEIDGTGHDAVEDLIKRVSESFVVAEAPPTDYCAALPWKTAKTAMWTGHLVSGEPLVLAPDKRVCGINGRAVWEIEVSSDMKQNLLTALIGQKVSATGTLEVGHLRPIASKLSKLEAAK